MTEKEIVLDYYGSREKIGVIFASYTFSPHFNLIRDLFSQLSHIGRTYASFPKRIPMHVQEAPDCILLLHSSAVVSYVEVWLHKFFESKDYDYLTQDYRAKQIKHDQSLLSQVRLLKTTLPNQFFLELFENGATYQIKRQLWRE